MTYNAAGQRESEAFPDGTSNTYTYDARGRLRTATDPQGTTTISYDDATDRITRIDYPQSRWLAYLYDNAGRRTRMSDESGAQTRYVYDSAGRLLELRDAVDALIVRYGYDSAGRVAREDKGNGTYTVTTFDVLSRVESITNFAPNGTVNSRFAYTYDLTGRRTSMDTIDGKWTYTYDLTGQLTRAVFDSTNPAIADQDLNYKYDSLGNRIRTLLNGVTTNYTTNNLNQYTAAGGTTFGYDRDGNLTTQTDSSGTTTSTYDALNRLIKVVSPTGTSEYEYDALGNRIAVTENGVRKAYEWDPFGLSNVNAMYDASGSRLSTFTHGIGLESVSTSAGRLYYDFEAIGSTADMTNGAGAIVNNYGYEPFGGLLRKQEAIANENEFIGEWGVNDDGGARRFMRARYYNASSGRFSTIDPLRLLGGANLIEYASNSPTALIDPKGLRPGLPKFPIPQPPLEGPTFQQPTYVPPPWFLVPFLPHLPPVERQTAPPTSRQAIDSSDDILNDDIQIYKNLDDDLTALFTPEELDPWSTPGGSIPITDGKPGDKGSSGKPTSVDPNEKLAAGGFGPQAFIAAGSVIPYRINFENFGPGTLPTPKVVQRPRLSGSRSRTNSRIFSTGARLISPSSASATRWCR